MPDTHQNFSRQLDAMASELSAEGVRLRQVHLQGYILALSEAGVIDEVGKLQFELLLEARVDLRLADLDESSDYSGQTANGPISPSPVGDGSGAPRVNRISNHPTERDRPGLLMARAAFARREGQYGDAYRICDLLIEQIGVSWAPKEPSYDDLLAAAARQNQQ